MIYDRELPKKLTTENHEARLDTVEFTLTDHEGRINVLEAIAETGEQVDWSGVTRMADQTTQTLNLDGEMKYVFPQGSNMGSTWWGNVIAPQDGYFYYTVNYSCSVRDGNSWLAMAPNVNGVEVAYVGTANTYDSDDPPTYRNRSFVQFGPLRVNSGDIVGIFGGDSGDTVWTAYNGNAYFIPIVRNKLSNGGDSTREVTYTKETTMYQSNIDIAHVQAPDGDMPLTPMTETVAHAQNDVGYWNILQSLLNTVQATQALLTEQQHSFNELLVRVSTLEENPVEPPPEYNMDLPLVLKTPPLIGLLGIEIGGVNLIGSGYTVQLEGLIVVDGAASIGLLTPTWIAKNGEKLDPLNPLAVLTIIGGGNSGQFAVSPGDVLTESGMGNITFYPRSN